MKKLNYKVLLIIIGLVLLESVFYLLSKSTPFAVSNVTLNIDNKIPFIKSFVYFYFLWYFMLLIVPYMLYLFNKNNFYKYASICILSIIISSLIFFFFPTTMLRPTVTGHGLSIFLIKSIYYVDTPVLNCFPSMHVTLCLLFMYTTFITKEFNKKTQVLIYLLSTLIIMSTIFIKQHVILDIIGAVVVIIISIILSNLFKLDKKIKSITKNII